MATETDLKNGSAESSEFNVASYKLECEPNSIYYIPDFITEQEEKLLVDNVNRVPKPRWTQLSNRRLQNWGGIPHPKGMIAENLPDWLKKYTGKIGQLSLFDGKVPNHVLVNEYKAGEGIMPHLDGPLFYPTITTINLNSHTVLNFYHPLDSDCKEKPEDSNSEQPVPTSATWKDRLAFSVFLQPRSLVILQNQCYDYYLHGIDEVTEDQINSSVINWEKCSLSIGDTLKRSTRISLTIRHVPKTTKPLIKLGR